MIKNKQLLLFLQSRTTDLYVNILVHCVNNESVDDVYFAINEGDETALAEAKMQIRDIRERLRELMAQMETKDLLGFHQDYEKTLNKIPTLDQIEDSTIQVLFSKPELSAKNITKYFKRTDDLIVDISGCSKKASIDIVASFMSDGIRQIRHFELDQKVYDQKIAKIYHKICDRGLRYYDYIDFSRPGTTAIGSFNKMRLQGNLIRVLLVIALLLGISVVILIQQNQTSLAALTSVLFSVLTAVSLIIGLLNSGFDFFDRFK